jgi:exonuclease III
MSLLSWNCQGLGNPGAVRDLCQLMKEKKPKILFLMETKCRKDRMEVLRVKIGFEGMFVVDPVGRSGGLALCWKDKDLVEIQNFSRRHINAVIRPSVGENGWKFTGFYGHPVWTKRHESWSLLRHLNDYLPQAWLCVGDFNEITNQTEKVGTTLRREGQMAQFREVLEECSLSDLGFMGSKYTWNNGREDDGFIKERLDRAVANLGWCSLFQKVEVKVLAARMSDHKPLLLSFSDDVSRIVGSHRGSKFEARWLHDKESQAIITRAWGAETYGEASMHTAQQKLAACKNALASWSWRKYGNVEKEVRTKTKRLAKLQLNECQETMGQIKQLTGEIDCLLEQEDTKWKQRAKQNWYQNGDRNTPFFHAWANH